MGRFLVTHIRPTFAPRAASTGIPAHVPHSIKEPTQRKKAAPFGSGSCPTSVEVEAALDAPAECAS